VRHIGLSEPLIEAKAANSEVIQLRSLTAHLFTVQESERRRISREIHDDLIQRLGVLEIQLETMKRTPAGEGRRNSELESLRASVAELTEDLHRICYDLHPVLLDSLGLAAAVQFLCEECTRMRGIQVKFLHHDVPKVPENVSLCLYRVVQESLQNIAKHARADRASVSLAGSDTCMRLVIRDTGCGFDPMRARANPGLGLTSLRERVRLLEGRCEIHSRVGYGTRIAVSVPLGAGRGRFDISRVTSASAAAVGRV
jgi:two-component system, NarL family, sensor kinase